MNIFKILGSAEGHIYEPSINAFLAYLLDPYANHGFEDRFFKKFLTSINHPISKQRNFQLINFSTSKEYEIFIQPEYAVEFIYDEVIKHESKLSEDKYIDIYIKILTNLVEQEQNTDGNLEDNCHFIIIENKIKKSLQEHQLYKEWHGFNGYLKNINTEFNPDNLKTNQSISFVYITPNSSKSSTLSNSYDSQFAELLDIDCFKSATANNKFACHLRWRNIKNIQELTNDFTIINDKTDISIAGIIRQILIEENLGFTSGIYDYSKHTLKAFVDFIENDFKSTKKTESENKPKYFKSLEELEQSGALKSLPQKTLLRIKAFEEKLTSLYPMAKIDFSKTHPVSLKFIKNGKLKKLLSLSIANKGSIDLITRNFTTNILDVITEILDNRTIDYTPYDDAIRISLSEFAKDEDVLSLVATFYDLFMQD